MLISKNISLGNVNQYCSFLDNNRNGTYDVESGFPVSGIFRYLRGHL